MAEPRRRLCAFPAARRLLPPRPPEKCTPVKLWRSFTGGVPRPVPVLMADVFFWFQLAFRLSAIMFCL
ncbi:MAG: hypothetical protein J6T08_02090 [Lentisphaeria bacterium]|nr:hypothetical protein [Lentisphaeria bacterium]